MNILNAMINLNSNQRFLVISSKDKFIRNLSVSPVLLLLDDNSDEDMNDLVDDPQSNSDSDSESETDPSTWHTSNIVNFLQDKSKDEAEQFFKDKEDLIRADSKRHEEELAEDYKDEDEDWYNKLMEEERVSLEKKLTSLSWIKDDVLDTLGIEKSSSSSPSPDNQEPSSDHSNEGQGSLIDDYADPNQFPADYTGGDD